MTKEEKAERDKRVATLKRRKWRDSRSMSADFTGVPILERKETFTELPLERGKEKDKDKDKGKGKVQKPLDLNGKKTVRRKSRVRWPKTTRKVKRFDTNLYFGKMEEQRTMSARREHAIKSQIDTEKMFEAREEIKRMESFFCFFFLFGRGVRAY